MADWFGGLVGPGSLAAPLSLAATGLTAYGKIDQGNTAATNALLQASSMNQADSYKAQQLSNEAATYRLQETQTDSDMRQALGARLANISVINAARNVAPGGSGDAVYNREEAVGDMNRQQKDINISNQADQAQAASAFYAQSGANALAQGKANAGADRTSGWLSGIGSGLAGLAGAVASPAGQAAGSSGSSLLASLAALL